MVNAWMQTVKKVKASMPKGTLLKDILIKAKKVYAEQKKKGVSAVGKVVSKVKKSARKSRRRRKGKKTQKKSKSRKGRKGRKGRKSRRK